MELTYDLSSDQMNALASLLEGLSVDVSEECDAAAQELANDAAEVAREHAKVHTGNLQGSISVQRTADGYDVVCSALYAAFVEFGTGLGSAPANDAALQAMAEAGWVINASGKGDAGWPFPTSESDTGWRLTHGQDGVGFMASGADAARSEIGSVYARHIGEALAK